MKILIYNENDPRYANTAPYVLQINDFIYRLTEDHLMDIVTQIQLALTIGDEDEETPDNDYD